MRESDIEAYLVKRAKEVGGLCRKLKWIGRKHAPDRVLMLPERDTRRIPQGRLWRMPGGTIWVELKAPGIPPDDGQVREHERMRKMGQHVVVIDSMQGVDDLLGVP